ncbi:MAG: hypothetical protein U0R78_18465 [Nocardioidaceae bacterium]
MQQSVSMAISEIVSAMAPPTSATGVSKQDKDMGLALLQAGLNLDHVLRVSESLTLVRSDLMDRHVTVDVDLSAVDPSTLDNLRTPSRGSDALSYWMPITRNTRSDLSPITITNQHGDAVLRMSFRRTVELVAAGTLAIFERILSAERVRARSESAIERATRHGDRSTWVLERALMELIHRGGSQGYRDIINWGERFESDFLQNGSSTGIVAEHSRQTPQNPYSTQQIKTRAIEMFEELFPEDDDPFLQLLTMAAQDYFVVGAVPASEPRSTFTYKALPVRPEWANDTWLDRMKRAITANLPIGQELGFVYRTEIAPNVRSFHVNLSVDKDVKIRQLVLVTDEDGEEVDYISETLAALSTTARDDVTMIPSPQDIDAHDAGAKLIEHELQSLVSRIRGVIRSRLGQIGGAAWRDWELNGAKLSEGVWTSDTETLQRLVALSKMNADGHLLHLRLTEELGRAEPLKRLSQKLAELQLSESLLWDNDPREYAGHLGWNRRTWPVQSRSMSTSVSAAAHARLVDDSPALSDAVRWLLACLVGLIGLIGYVAVGDLEWVYSAPTSQPMKLENADALVALLLLVPGILIARISFPEGNTVVGRLRTFPRRTAFAAVALTTALACGVAVREADTPGAYFQACVWALGLLLASLQLDVWTRRRRRRQSTVSNEGLPRWVAAATGASPAGPSPSGTTFASQTVRKAQP